MERFTTTEINQFLNQTLSTSMKFFSQHFLRGTFLILDSRIFVTQTQNILISDASRPSISAPP